MGTKDLRPVPDPLLTSSPVLADQVVTIGLGQVVSLLIKNARLLIAVPLITGILALGATWLVAPTFTATARFLPPQQGGGAAAMIAQQLGALAGLAGATAGIKNPADQTVGLMRTRTIADRLIERFSLVELYGVDFVQDARKALEKNSRIASSPKDGLVSVEVDDGDPVRAARMANAFVEELQALMKTLAIGEAAQRRQFFEEQLRSVRDALAKAEVALRSSGVAESVLKAEPRTAIELVARLKAMIVSAEVRIASLRGGMAPGHPDLRQAEQELAALRAQLSKAERSDVSETSSAGVDYVARYREFKYQEALFELMAKQFELAKIDEAREGSLLQIVDAAIPPERKSRPRRAAIAIAATFAALFLTMVFLIARESIAAARAVTASGASGASAYLRDQP